MSVATTPTTRHPWDEEGIDKLRFGVSVFAQPYDFNEFVGVVQRCEALGIDSYLTYDHPMDRADCWTSLAALAMVTETIRLGTIVDCILYRNPYLLLTASQRTATVSCEYDITNAAASVSRM